MKGIYTRPLTAGKIIFTNGDIIQGVKCQITDRFLIVDDETHTIYNLDSVERIENVEPEAKEQEATTYNCWHI